jgi:signal transduction histidine kinase
MKQYSDNEIKLLTEVLPHVAAQLRGSLGNIYSALHKIVTEEDRERNPAIDQSAAILSQSYYRVLRVVNNLTAAPMLLEEEPFPLENEELVDWLSALCREAQVPAETAGITLTFRTELRHHVAAIHREYMERLVWNLLSNALKFTPAGGRVDVMLRLAGDQVLLEVADTGCGISAKEMESVMERYLHTEQMDPPRHGFGLGLPLCRRIAQGHGGRLVLRSEEGRGTTVTVALPDRCVEDGRVRDVQPFHYAGGFRPVLLELSDALPFRAFLYRHLDGGA